MKRHQMISILCGMLNGEKKSLAYRKKDIEGKESPSEYEKERIDEAAEQIEALQQALEEL